MQMPRCDVCNEEVKIEEGLISISFREIREVQEKQEQFKKNHPGPVLDVGEVMAFPPRVSWVWHHCECDVNGASYQIEGSRFDSVTKALRWTLHLMQKNWFEFTDWRNLIERFYPECDSEDE